ncbi:MAG: hypothetical protein M1166_05055 [Candidatus Thermoplasmatota archaeon]|nr:hypothetical protein [Candidatus Thermoplasmatota archaeon]
MEKLSGGVLMVLRRFYFKAEDYRKYADFSHYDGELDTTASVYIARPVLAAFNRFRRLTTGISIVMSSGEELDHWNGNALTPFARALANTLAIKYWLPRVGQNVFENAVWNSPGMAGVFDLHVDSLFRRTDPRSSRSSIRMAATTRGMFTAPFKDLEIFPLGFSYPYCLTRYLLDEGAITSTMVLEFRSDVARWDDVIDSTLERIRTIIATGGGYIPLNEKITRQREFQSEVDIFYNSSFAAVAKVRRAKFDIIDKLTQPIDNSYTAYSGSSVGFVITVEKPTQPKQKEDLATLMKEFQFSEAKVDDLGPFKYFIREWVDENKGLQVLHFLKVMRANIY